MNNFKKVSLLILAATFFSFIFFNESSFKNDLTFAKTNYSFKKIEKKKGGIAKAKNDNPEQFIKYERDIRTLPGKDKPDYPQNYRIKEFLKAHKAKSFKDLKLFKTAGSISWDERGPANVQGRIRSVVVDPRDTAGNTWFVGSVGGGVWKTTDGGNTWQDLTSGLPNLSTSTIAMCNSNPDVLYVGTGEGYYNIDAIGGSGIWKSTDGGNTWNQLSSTTNAAQFRDVMRIVVNPNNANEVVVATSHNITTSSSGYSKILRSTDGGNSWTETLTNKNDIQQVVANPSNFKNLYAAVYGKGVYKSTDAGSTWAFSSVGLDFINLGRLELSVSPVNSQNLFLVADQNGSAMFYFSSDAGASWNKIKPDKNWLGGQGWYDNVVTADLFDQYSCYVGGIDIMKITVSGTSITTTPITDVYHQYHQPSKGVHPDQHVITLFTLNQGQKTFRMIVGNDGGVFYSDDAGSHFSKTGKGLNVTQFYSVDKRNGSPQYIGGTQDNGTRLSPKGIIPDATTSWPMAVGGDGFASVWNYSNPSLLLASLYNDQIVKSTDGGYNFNYSAPPLPENDDAPFITHLAKSNQDPDLIFTFSKAGIWRSDNFADSWNLITLQSGAFDGGRSFTQVEISLVDPQVVWAATKIGPQDSVLVSTDGGFTFYKTNPFNISQALRVSGFATDPIDRNTAYVLCSAANNPKIFRTTDLGKSWQELSGFGSAQSSSNGFPDVAVYSLLVMPFNTNIIWAGTEIGIFESTDNGASWHPLQSNLPATSIWQMRIVNDQIIVATHGRGAWTTTPSELSGYEPPKVTLGPEIKSITATKRTVRVNLRLRAVYDSTQIMFDNTVMALVKNTAPVDTFITINYSPTQPAVTRKIQAVSFKDSNKFKSGFVVHEFYNFNSVVTAYATNFNNSGNDFELNGFSINKEAGFSDETLHSLHPYNNSSEITATLLKPIVVAQSNAYLNYSDIALVEPGEANTKFGDPFFYDFVVVEGTKDGANWQPLADGYDARFDSVWLNYYYNNQQPDSTLFRTHNLNLLNSFNAGDTIIIRFRMFSDIYTNGYGWVIDNLEIQKKLTAVKNNFPAPQKFALYQNYPNPFNPTTIIKYSLPSESNVNLIIYNSLGQKVTELLNRKQKAGVYNYRFNASNLASGIYFYRITAGKFTSVKKMILLK